ncbi:energy-coupling factor transporter ATPase [Coprococcus sp. CLA-AA-H212]|jgi:energy-coupling factor transporter ATPase|uniref:Energy-coupling factor transporter ATP-binding protein EcfA2 n=1 Tax=Coprococcus hominis (ex Arizal et al. 2022) TaxID=2881262 RepID=A0ABS8FRY0_9FIRM|nr:energy-coupling factor transporter ATPase [Coprococcus hominis (ex Arizal et al. 2022)]MCC2219995.1 energy-coupling factor transporter ATPase [Coprococcus hominis (ex Arizal et al. 2022)]RHU86528.1 energy-coupling factor transporter ATPase [Clostridium sp. OM08-29]
MEDRTVIRAEQVRFQYKKRDVDGNVIATEEILKGVDLTIKKGEFIALLGRNGSGKTTFSKQLNAILRPSEGTVTVDEMGTRDAEKLYEIRQHVGMVFQNPDNQMVAANVEEEVAFGPENLGMESDTIVARVKQALEQVRMWKRRKTAPNHLSGGQKQRIAIAGILAMHPDYIVLDEPTAMLDPKGRKEVMEALQRLNQEQEMTVILITHDMEEAALASRVILLADGQMRFDGRPEKFFGADALLAEMGMEAPLSYRVRKLIDSDVFEKKIGDARVEEATIDKREKVAEYDKTGREWEASSELVDKKKNKKAEAETDEKNQDLLSLQHVSYIYSPGTAYEKVALDDVNLSLGKGEIVGLAGHTGSGKSTMIQLLNGLLKPTGGTVTFEGKDIHAKGYSGNYLRSKVGMVFQYPEHQMICDTVWEDVAFGPSKQGLTGEACETRVEEALRFVDLPEKYYQASPLQLSGGQKRRVAIAGVLAMHPEYIILDEPAAGLDAAGKREIFDRIRRMSREQGIGVLLVSHSMEDLAEYADRIIVLDDGKKILDDRPAQIFAKRETLADCGLDVPETVKLADKLRANGYQIPQNVIREKELLDYLGNCTNSTAGRKSVDTENRLDERKQGDNL